jgi:DNA uptake protein ComE-like DNA-binding protein
MKKFLAVLSVALAAAVLLERRGWGRTRRRKQELPAADEGPEKQRGISEASSRAQAGGSSSRQEQEKPAWRAGTPAPGESRAEAAHRKRARSPEEVLNSATRQQLLSVYGIGPVLADRIIRNRPYAAAYDVVEQGIIPESIFVQLRKQLLEQPSA